MSIYQRIKYICKKRGMTVKQLDKLAFPAIKGQVVGRFDESKPSIDKVAAVALILGVSIDYLAGLTDIEEPAARNGDGLSNDLCEFINLLPTLTPAEVSVLLAAAKAQLAGRRSPGVEK